MFRATVVILQLTNFRGPRVDGLRDGKSPSSTSGKILCVARNLSGITESFRRASTYRRMARESRQNA